MRRKTLTSAAAALACATLAVPASRLAADSRTRAHVEALASARLDGRLAGSRGEQLAAEYISAELQRIGAKPLAGASGFLEPFEFTAGTKDGGSTFGYTAIDPPHPGSAEGGFTQSCAAACARALSFSDNGDAQGPVVFAGYGIAVPESQGLPYDSYAGLDVKDRIVLVLRYFPEEADVKTKQVLARYADLRYKAMTARQHGARAIVVVTGPHSPNAGELAPMTFDTALAGSGIVAISVTGDVAGEMLRRGSGKSLAEAQALFDSGNPHAAGFPLERVTARVHAAVTREKQTGHNVVAYLPASGGAASGIARPWVMLGAHYDHLGHGSNGNSLARKEEAGQVHAGADDNASGSAAVLSIGAALAAKPRRRNVLLAFWSGEELGLLGSAAFAASPPIPLDAIEAYLNFDMVGRMQDNRLTVQAVGSSAAWRKILEQTNIAAGFDLQLQDDPYQPTDVATFNAAAVPALSFFTGTHADYHRPTDTADKIDYADLDRVVDFAAAIVARLDETATPPAFAKVDMKTETGGGRAGVRVFTGTIPDYSTEVKGLLLSGVIGGGPAEQAGLRKGDIIVEIAGQTITNIYDYTYALDVLKIGQPARVVYIRDGRRSEATLIPAARK